MKLTSTHLVAALVLALAGATDLASAAPVPPVLDAAALGGGSSSGLISRFHNPFSHSASASEAGGGTFSRSNNPFSHSLSSAEGGSGGYMSSFQGRFGHGSAPFGGVNSNLGGAGRNSLGGAGSNSLGGRFPGGANPALNNAFHQPVRLDPNVVHHFKIKSKVGADGIRTTHLKHWTSPVRTRPIQPKTPAPAEGQPYFRSRCRHGPC